MINTTMKANEQHYELPCEFFEMVMGKHMKYSSRYFQPGVSSLDEAEAEMLALTCRRAASPMARISSSWVAAGARSRCGWPSVIRTLASPACRTHVLKKQFIEAARGSRGRRNIQIITCDMNDLDAGSRRFDRVVSVEMFEHMRNYEQLLARIGSWLKPSGTLFVHIFTHRDYAYPFDVRDENDWMARYFFTGGIMPSDHLLSYFQRDCGCRTIGASTEFITVARPSAGLQNMDANRARIEPILAATYGAENVRRWWVYWRVFFMACAELWGYRGGREWFVSHYQCLRK